MPSAWFGPQTNRCRQTRPFIGPWEFLRFYSARTCSRSRSFHALLVGVLAERDGNRSNLEGPGLGCLSSPPPGKFGGSKAVKRRGPTRQSSTESHTAEGRTEICVGILAANRN